MHIRIMVLACLFLCCAIPPVKAQDMSSDAVQRGAYLAKLGDCTACHTLPGHASFAGGLPVRSPFGAIYATNITPDKDYGIGAYSLNDFTRAIRDGIARDGHHLYPAMPYTSYVKMSDSDAADLYAFFMKGVAPIHEKPPVTKLPFPFNQRWALALWNAAFAPHKRYEPSADQDALWNRGAYLAQSVGHCGACHTPRDLAFHEEGYTQNSLRYLTGNTLDHWNAANLHGDDATGLGRWTEADIASFLHSGYGANAVAFGNMGQVVEDSTQYATQEDLHALAHYLKSLSQAGENAAYAPPKNVTAPNQPLQEHPGAGLFMSACAGCHGKNGEGHLPEFPAIAGNPAVLAKDPTSLIRIVLEGGKSPLTANGPPPRVMPAFGKLTDREIGEVLSFIRNDWGNQAAPVSTRDVMLVRHALKKQAGQ